MVLLIEGRRSRSGPGEPLIGEMKRSLATAAWTAIVSYCLISLTLGPFGVLAFRDADGARNAMEGNIVELERMNRAFERQWQALRADAQSVALEGRTLGYLAYDEVAIRLSVGGRPGVPASPGDILTLERSGFMDDGAIKLFALGLGVAVGIVTFGLGRMRRETGRE